MGGLFHITLFAITDLRFYTVAIIKDYSSETMDKSKIYLLQSSRTKFTAAL